MTAESTRDEIEADAREYVDQQLATMRQFGQQRELSPEEYERAVQQVVAVTLRWLKEPTP